MQEVNKLENLKLEETNCAYLGSDIEKKVKLAAALTESAWNSVGNEPGLKVWRIEQFKVVEWPESDYGSFYSGDSYIVIHNYLENNKLKRNAHMWVGSFTTLDEAGTAAYKIVELDDVFNGQITLYRESQSFESDIFLNYFENGIKILIGGVESGFKKVKSDVYEIRLLHVRKCSNNTIKVVQRLVSYESLNSGDCFILDTGLVIYIWNGKNSSPFEKFKSSAVSKGLAAERNGKAEIVTVEENSESEEFWRDLGGKGQVKIADQVNDLEVHSMCKSMFRLSDSSGSLTLTQVEFGKNSLRSEDVFFVDVGSSLSVWIGKNTSLNEKKNCMKYAWQYLKTFNKEVSQPFCLMREGEEPFNFLSVFA